MSILTKYQKRRYLRVLLVMLAMAVFEVVGVASILPFMQLASSPERVADNSWVSMVRDLFGLQNNEELLVYFGLMVVVVIVIGNALKVLATWMQQKFAWEVSHEIGTKLLRIYLNKPYLYFTQTNSSDILSKLIVESSRATTGVLIPLGQIISYSVVSLLIAILLFVVDPKVAAITVLVMVCAFGLVYYFANPFLKKLGSEKISANQYRFKHLKEIIAGIKTFRVFNVESYFYDRFDKVSLRHSKIQPKVSLVGIVPKHIFDVFIFGTVVFGVIFFIQKGDDIKPFLPIISLYVFAGYKLLPAVQRIYTSAVNMRHAFEAVQIIADDLVGENADSPKGNKNIEKLSFDNSISIDKLSFSYDDHEITLKEIDLVINKGDTVAFVGTTGSGKSTLIDLLVGLIFGQSGQIMVDEKILNSDTAKAWQQNLSYVAQDIFLFDDSIKRNIAIGLSDDEIDNQRMAEILALVDLEDFVQTDLPSGLETIVGERGVRLSGGQKQRIGLARALYRQPAVLILDEATSALDNITERHVIDGLKKHFADLTIIMVAHRISTVQHANKIYMLEQGAIASAGSYEELISNNHQFEEMVRMNQ